MRGYRSQILAGKKMPSYSVEKLTEFCEEVLQQLDLSKEEAGILADSLILADLRGVTSHGIVRLPTYVQRIETGVLDPKAVMEFETHGGAVALLDARNGFGQLAGHKAMNTAIDLAADHGIGLVGVKNSNHFGITAYYSMMALDRDMIGLVITNTSPAIAPFGTLSSLLGTNPVSIAVPAAQEKPIVLDMSMSVVARGKIRYSALTKKEIPLGWALDEQGNPTTDPNVALKGSLVPIGGAKGSGLSLIVEILCGILTGSCLTGEVKNITDMSAPAQTGHAFVAINIKSFINPDQFKASIDAVIRKIKSLPSKQGEPVYMAGEIEYNLEEALKREGIALDDDVVEALNSLSERYSVMKL
jgi:LDH2 family malate/lactate/ureidoglycolate dehydrogenase